MQPAELSDVLHDIPEEYRERFVELCGAPPESASADVERDRRFRATLFDPRVDPVWGRVGHLVGEARATEMRQLLSGALAL